LEPVQLRFKAVVYEPGQPIDHVYFPTSGIISLLVPPEQRGGIEVGVVGREGMAGLPVFLHVKDTVIQSIVQMPGEALRMRADDFRECVSRSSMLHGLLLRYTHVFMTQLSQWIACNSLHSVEKRMCRWLLTVHDRLDTDHFPLTHEFLAAMLGVRRATVTEAARSLRQAGLIRYGGGQLVVLDRHGLESAGCGCHRVVQAEAQRLLG
jgi:CRP-like cAMP-binding protein